MDVTTIYYRFELRLNAGVEVSFATTECSTNNANNNGAASLKAAPHFYLCSKLSSPMIFNL